MTMYSPTPFGTPTEISDAHGTPISVGDIVTGEIDIGDGRISDIGLARVIDTRSCRGYRQARLLVPQGQGRYREPWVWAPQMAATSVVAKYGKVSKGVISGVHEKVTVRGAMGGAKSGTG